MVRLLPQYRGVRIKPYIRHMNYILFVFFFSPFFVAVLFYMYLHIKDYQVFDYVQIGLTVGLCLLSVCLSIYLTCFLQEVTLFFKKMDRLGKLFIYLF